MFRVGQKVVCIDVKPRPGRFWVFRDAPVKGRIYTIASTFIIEGHDAVTLVEQKRHPMSEYQGYAASRFRPIADRPTDISVFKEMLHPSKIAEVCDV